MLSKKRVFNVSFNAFLNDGFLSYFGADIYNQFLKDCRYFGDKSKLIIQTTNAEIGAFINEKLILDIADFCKASWPQFNIVPIVCIDQLDNDNSLFSNIDNIVSINENSEHSFDDFVVQNQNRVAFESVACISGKIARILDKGSLVYITGGVGVGKTHLLKAATNYAKKHKQKNIYYASAEVFGSRYVMAIKENTLSQLRNEIISYDALFIDDIGFISHRKSTIEELGSIISIMLDNKKDVIISSSADISTFQDCKRLYSRLSSSVIVSLPIADTMLKKEIIKLLINKCNINLSEEIILFLASSLFGGAREIKSAIERIKINRSSINEISLPIIKNFLSDMISDQTNIAYYKNDVETILINVASFYQISLDDIRNIRKIKNNKIARSVGMYFCRELCGLVYAQISKEFNLAVHTSVMSSIKKIKDQINSDEKFANEVDIIMQNIKLSLK